MKRLYTSIIILAAILGLSFFNLRQTKNISDQSFAIVEEMIENTKSGRLDKTAALAEQFFDDWEKAKVSVAWCIRHTPIDRITSLASQIAPLARQEDTAQLSALLAELSVRVRELYQEELPTFQNLS